MKLLSKVNEAKDLATKEYIDEKAGIKVETDPVFSSSPSASITLADISKWNGKQDAISDLASIRSGAALGATALQSETYRGTVTGIKVNGTTKSPSSGIVDIGTVITSHQQLKTINGQSLAGSGNITIGGTPRIEMTASSAALEPNKFYVWPMMDALDLTLGAEQTSVMNRYLFQFRNPKAGLTMLTLPDDITWSEDTELDENGLPVMEAAAFYRIEIIEGLASLKKWKLVYMVFADAEVERVLMANGVGDGIGITKKDLKNTTTIGAWFDGNTIITQFNELKEFVKVTSLANYAFRDCSSLSVIDLSNINSMGMGALWNCLALTGEMVLPNINGALGDRAFQRTGLTHIEIPNATSLGTNMFQSSPSLLSVILKNVTSIGASTCASCSKFNAFVCLATIPPTMIGSNHFIYSNKYYIYVPDESIEAYKTATKWSGYASRIRGISELASINPSLYEKIQKYL